VTQALWTSLQKEWRIINEHLVNIFEEGELRREATIRTIRLSSFGWHARSRSRSRALQPAAIIAVGYACGSQRGTAVPPVGTVAIERVPGEGLTRDASGLKTEESAGQGGQANYFLTSCWSASRHIRLCGAALYQKVSNLRDEASTTNTQHGDGAE